MDKKKSLIQELGQFARAISKDYPIHKMILFGSQATGKTHGDSDVDIMIVSKKFEGVRRLDRAPDLYMKWNLNYPVDILCYTPEEFSRKKKFFGVVQQAAQEGIEIKAS